MSTRKVKDAKDLSTNELIYFKGHAQATYMSDGRTVEEAITSSTGGSGGTITDVIINGISKSENNGVVDLGYVTKPLRTTTSSNIQLVPNTYCRNTNTSLSTLNIILMNINLNASIINEYFVEFTTSSSGTTVKITSPSGIKWANGETPTFEASTTYQISIVNNLGTYQKFK